MNPFDNQEGKEESLSEYQREILEAVGVSSLVELDKLIADLDGGFQEADPNSPEEGELMAQLEYFKKLRDQLHE